MNSNSNNNNNNSNSSSSKITRDSNIISSSSSKSGTIISELGPNDVLLGRGTGPNENQGNVRFRELLKGVIAKYENVGLETSKAQITYDVLGTLKACNGRFVRKLSKEETLTFYAQQEEEDKNAGSAGANNVLVGSATLIHGTGKGGGKKGEKQRIRHFEKLKKKFKKMSNRPLYVIVSDSVASEKTKQSIRFQIKASSSNDTTSAACSSSSSSCTTAASSLVVGSDDNTSNKTKKNIILTRTLEEQKQQEQFMSTHKVQQKQQKQQKQKQRPNSHFKQKITSIKQKNHQEEQQREQQQSQAISNTNENNTLYGKTTAGLAGQKHSNLSTVLATTNGISASDRLYSTSAFHHDNDALFTTDSLFGNNHVTLQEGKTLQQHNHKGRDGGDDEEERNGHNAAGHTSLETIGRRTEENQRNADEGTNKPSLPPPPMTIETPEASLEQRYARMCLMLAQQDEEQARLKREQQETAALLNATTTTAAALGANTNNSTTMEGLISSLPTRYLAQLISGNGRAISSAAAVLAADHRPPMFFPSAPLAAAPPSVSQEAITSLALLERIAAIQQQQQEDLSVARTRTALSAPRNLFLGTGGGASSGVFPQQPLGILLNSSLSSPLSDTDLDILRRVASGTVLQQANNITSQSPASW